MLIIDHRRKTIYNLQHNNKYRQYTLHQFTCIHVGRCRTGGNSEVLMTGEQ